MKNVIITLENLQDENYHSLITVLNFWELQQVNYLIRLRDVTFSHLSDAVSFRSVANNNVFNKSRIYKAEINLPNEDQIGPLRSFLGTMK